MQNLFQIISQLVLAIMADLILDKLFPELIWEGENLLWCIHNRPNNGQMSSTLPLIDMGKYIVYIVLNNQQ